MSGPLFWILIGLAGLLASCESHKEDAHGGAEVIQITDPPLEIKIPSLLWDLLETKKIMDSKGVVVNNPETNSRYEENVFVGVKVFLKEKTHGILGGKNFELRSLKSGMTLDLAHYIKLPKGTFIIRFEPEYTVDPKTAQVFFFSQSLKRRQNEQNMGSGCDHFFDVTNFYLKTLRTTGIEVNVTEGRHVSLLAGTFFIRVSHEMGVRALTQLTLSDSNYPELQCNLADELDERE